MFVTHNGIELLLNTGFVKIRQSGAICRAYVTKNIKIIIIFIKQNCYERRSDNDKINIFPILIVHEF